MTAAIRLDKYLRCLQTVDTLPVQGKVAQVVGLVVEAVGPAQPLQHVQIALGVEHIPFGRVFCGTRILKPKYALDVAAEPDRNLGILPDRSESRKKLDLVRLLSEERLRFLPLDLVA